MPILPYNTGLVLQKVIFKCTPDIAWRKDSYFKEADDGGI